MADISDVAMEPHHIIRDRISTVEATEGTTPSYEPIGDLGDASFAGAPGLPIPQGGENA